MSPDTGHPTDGTDEVSLSPPSRSDDISGIHGEIASQGVAIQRLLPLRHRASGRPEEMDVWRSGMTWQASTPRAAYLEGYRDCFTCATRSTPSSRRNPCRFGKDSGLESSLWMFPTGTPSSPRDRRLGVHQLV